MGHDSSIEDSFFGLVLQDSYKIVGMLGQGGMGAVYDAVQIRLNKRVAIKVMARDLASNTEALNRFHREAMITSGLGHPHIVQVFDFSTTPSGQPFLAMEFLAGEDLDRRIARLGRLTAAQTVHIVRQVASALAATHAQGIVHRDLKPANIYLLNVAGEDDFVKVLDFGISKIRASNTKITKASALIGTPDYMSPEQAMGQGDEVDDRTDQWALACIAWECLSGKGPFFGDSIPSMLFQVVHRDPPSLSAMVSDLPYGVEDVLRRALSKNKGDRFPNVTEFAYALEAAVTARASAVILEEMKASLSASTSVSASGSASAPSASGPVAVSETIPATSSHTPVTVPITPTAAYDSLPAEERSERPTTTFSQAAKETLSEKAPSKPKWRWAAVGGGVAVLSLLAFLVLRPGPSSKQPTPSSASSAPAVAAPVAAPVPPAAPPPSPPPAAEPSAPAAPTAPAPSAAAPAEAKAPIAEDTKPAEAETKPVQAVTPEGKPRAKKPGSIRKAAATKPPPKTEQRLIKEL